MVRFDRIGALSPAALDAELVGQGGAWCESTQALVREGQVRPETVPQVRLLWAYGVPIGNVAATGKQLAQAMERLQRIA